MAATELNL